MIPANRPMRKVSALKRFLMSRFLAPSERSTPISFVLSTTDTYVMTPIMTEETIREIAVNATRT